MCDTFHVLVSHICTCEARYDLMSQIQVYRIIVKRPFCKIPVFVSKLTELRLTGKSKKWQLRESLLAETGFKFFCKIFDNYKGVG